MNDHHIPEDDLELYVMGKICDEAEAARIEEHLLCCEECVARAEEAEAYVRTMRAALRRVNEEEGTSS